MKIYIACYPQLQLGHNPLTKRHDQNNKAPKIKRHTHTQKTSLEHWTLVGQREDSDVVIHSTLTRRCS